MSSNEPGQGWPTPPGRPPAGSPYNGPATPPAGSPYNGPATPPAGSPHGGYGTPPAGPAYGGYGTPPPPSTPPRRTSSHRGAWIGAAATLVAAVIGVAGTYLVNNRDKEPTAATAPSASSATPADDKPTADGTPTPTPTDSASAPSGTPSQEALASATPSGPAPGTVQWQGVLVIPYIGDKDLDAAPPADAENSGDSDFNVYPFGDHMLQPDNGAKSLVWKDTAKLPSYEDCAGVIGTQATGVDIRLKTGLTICGVTGEGRIVRLTVKELAGLANDTTATFDVVVWNG
ncbi:hypothetical protein AB0E83_17575 [Streptomyces sp. NPDC035033]|uniref:hypothetical protein n=1 Tax=Streptomyces sp. NPDC035033 TaxID=3155368 RepID=UPI0033FDDB17